MPVSALIGGLALLAATRIGRGLNEDPGRAQAVSLQNEGPMPRAAVDSLFYQFGIVDPAAEVAHRFVIRNEGGAPLALSRGRTSCKCTMSDLPQGVVPPGGAVEVRVSSKIRQKQGTFSHTAEILANDPDNRRLVLRILGTIRAHLAADPPRIVLPNAKRGRVQVLPVTLYSQVWDDFTIGRTSSSLADLKCKATPADPETLARFSARSGYRLEVTVPPRVESGSFWDWLKLTVRPGDPAAPPRSFELDIAGTVLDRISIFGRHVEQGRVLKIGPLRFGEGAEERFTVQVRDDHRELHIHRIETEPAFLQVRVAPRDEQAARFGLYMIDVKVPADAPPSNFMGSHRGQIRIVTDHPKSPVLTVDVDFAIASSS